MNGFLEAIILTIILLCMLIGLIFTALPPLPGPAIIWAAAVFYGLILGWEEHLGWLTFIILTILMVIGVVADVVTGHVGTRWGGASWLAITVGFLLGLLLGILSTIFSINPIIGCFSGAVGMLLGLFAVEWWRNDDYTTAIKALKGYCAGTTLGIIAKIAVALLMIGVFLLRVFVMI